MGIIHQVCFYQILKITGLKCRPQFLKQFVILKTCQRVSAVDPDIEHAQAIDKSLGIQAEVCFPQLKFLVI